MSKKIIVKIPDYDIDAFEEKITKSITDRIWKEVGEGVASRVKEKAAALVDEKIATMVVEQLMIPIVRRDQWGDQVSKEGTETIADVVRAELKAWGKSEARHNNRKTTRIEALINGFLTRQLNQEIATAVVEAKKNVTKKIDGVFLEAVTQSVQTLLKAK